MVTSVSCGLFYLIIYRVISLDPTQMKSTWFISFQGMTKSLEPLQRSFKNKLSDKYSYNLLFERTKYQKRGGYRDVQRYLAQILETIQQFHFEVSNRRSNAFTRSKAHIYPRIKCKVALIKFY